VNLEKQKQAKAAIRALLKIMPSGVIVVWKRDDTGIYMSVVDIKTSKVMP
jgi:surface antigen